MNTDVIAIYSPSEKIWGGGQIYIEELCRYLNTRGKSAFVLTSEPDSFQCPTIPMSSVACRRRRLLSTIGLSQRLKQMGAGTIVLNDLSCLWLAPVFRMMGFRVLALLHLPLSRRNDAGLGHGPLEYRLLQISAHFCHAIASVNKNNLSIFKSKAVFVGNFVPDWFFGQAERRGAKYDFVMVTRFSKQKNIGLFIELLANLARYAKRPYTALLVGDGPERKFIDETIAKYGLQDSVTVQSWAHRQELPGVYDQGRCFVISSHHEGFATTLLEAHARGVPAIVTRGAGFCGEFIEGYGKPTGLVFEPDDVRNEAFLQEVCQLVQNYACMAQPCIEKARIFSAPQVLGTIDAQLATL